MIDTPLVSVIVPCYNQGKWLRECLASIKACTYPNLEIIVVDDGSTDEETRQIFNTFNEEGVCLVRQENQGLCGVRNRMARLSKGRYILSFDCDDVMMPTYIEHAIEVFRKKPDVSMVSGAFVLLDDTTGELSNPVYGIQEGYLTIKEMANNIIPSNYIYKRELFESLNGFSMDMNHLAIEDCDFTMRAMMNGFRVYIMPEVIFKYRQHGESMNNHQWNRIKGKIKILRHCWRWFACHPMYLLAFLCWRVFGRFLANKPYVKA